MTTDDSAGADTIRAARSWLDQDPDEITRAELAALIHAAESGDDASATDLRDRFGARLQFGTAGLRGALGAGPNRMNRVLVAQAAAGLAAWLRAREGAPSIVIGYDGRTRSDAFARDTAEIMAGAGVQAVLLPRMLPTPVLAFAVRHLGASAGVMVTASHNPPADNGYKVYVGGAEHGAQITAPVDREIADRIREAAEGDIRDIPRTDGYALADESVLDEYVRRTAALGAPAGPLRFAYTAMHGVGWETASRVFREAGFDEPVPVAAQQHPDAAFPTVAFPNPEEPGALDLAYRTASDAGVELIVAHDPDADRLAIAVPAAGGWRRLTGNEVGWLLGWRIAERIAAREGDGTLAASLVSSPALRVVAREYGLDHVETLTGFKWIARAGGLIFGYEEALGYLVDPGIVRDKDGISAAVEFLSLASELAASGRTVDDRLREFAERFGGHASAQVSVRVVDLAVIPRLMAGLRDEPPRAIGALRVERMDDFADGFGAFPPSDLLRLTTERGGRVIVRPSGTEPKVKAYLDAVSDEGDGAERIAAAQRVVDELDRGVRELLR